MLNSLLPPASPTLFSIGALEGQRKRATGVLVPLSVQNLVDCSTDYGNEWCGQGKVYYSYQYIMENGGIDTEASYPFKGYIRSHEPCTFNRSTVGASVTGYVALKEGDEEVLKVAVATQGPISVGVDAQDDFFVSERGGWNICSMPLAVLQGRSLHQYQLHHG